MEERCIGRKKHRNGSWGAECSHRVVTSKVQCSSSQWDKCLLDRRGRNMNLEHGTQVLRCTKHNVEEAGVVCLIRKADVWKSKSDAGLCRTRSKAFVDMNEVLWKEKKGKCLSVRI